MIDAQHTALSRQLGIYHVEIFCAYSSLSALSGCDCWPDPVIFRIVFTQIFSHFCSGNCTPLSRVVSPKILAMADQTSRLTAAADEFEVVEAATQVADAMALEQLVLDLNSLKESVDHNLNTVVEAMKSPNELFNTKIDILTQHVASVNTEITNLTSGIERVKKDIGAIKWELEEERKQQTLERAIKLAHVGSFVYCDIEGTEWDSPELAIDVIELFLLGGGAFLPEAILTTKVTTSMKRTVFKKQANQRAFRKFVEQITNLIGRDPRLGRTTTGRTTTENSPSATSEAGDRARKVVQLKIYDRYNLAITVSVIWNKAGSNPVQAPSTTR